MSCDFYRTVIDPGVIFLPQVLQENENRNSALNILILLLSSTFIAADNSSTGYTAGTVSDSSRFSEYLQDRNRSRCRLLSSRFNAADSSSIGYRAGTVSDSTIGYRAGTVNDSSTIGYRAGTVSDSSTIGYRAVTVSDSSRFPGILQDRNRSR